MKPSPTNRYFVAGHRAYAVEQAPVSHDDGFLIRFTNGHYEAEIAGVWQQIIVADFAD